MTLGDRLKTLRLSSGISQVDLADRLNISKQTLYKYENNIVTNIPSDKIEAAAKIFKVSPSYLMGWDLGDDSSATAVVIPVLGRVAAGIPITATEYIIDTEEIPQDMASDGEYYGLQVKGDSMEPRIKNGDVVIARKQSDADDGDVVIALINGDDAVVKRLKKYEDGIALVSTNPAYDPMYFSNEEIESRPIQILGKVKELRAKF